jgi:aerotolerance regulator-like protein/VWA domain-containing protein
MGFLSPWFLLAGIAVAVPLILHLFHRHEAQRVVFPAIQYLLRTERDHARTIRFRQLLLLLLRTLAITALVLVGARPFLRGGGGVHEPTTLVIILDNSMSSGRIVDEERVLERLKRAALESLDRVGHEDRVWVLRAGEPWAPAIQGTTEELVEAVRDTEVSAAGGNVSEALERAHSLVSQSTHDLREIHLISDGQADPGSGVLDIGAVSLVIYAADLLAGANSHLDSLSIGGGLAPLANERSQLALRVDGVGEGADRPLRLIVDGSIRGAVSGAVGTTAVLPFGPFTIGWISGFVETDPDALAADDRRYFAFSVRPAPIVSTSGARSFFLESALAVMESADRVRRSSPGTPPDARLALGAAGLNEADVPAVVFPDGDPNTLPALNRRLAAAGVPWRYAIAPARGEAGVVTTPEIPVDLSETRVRSHFQLIPDARADTSRVLARLTSGEPWIVDADTGAGRVLLLASPIEEDASSLPVTAVMIPLLDWALGTWSAGEGASGEVSAGSAIPLPVETAVVVDARGNSHPVQGLKKFEETRWAGIYDLLSDEGTIARVAVNPPSSESSMNTLTENSFRVGEGGSVTFLRNRDRWRRGIFLDSQGPEVGREFLVITLLLLLIESFVAAAGATGQARNTKRSGQHELPAAPAQSEA